jgi:hypothetical protein
MLGHTAVVPQAMELQTLAVVAELAMAQYQVEEQAVQAS